MAEITKTKDQKPETKNRIVWILFAFLAVAVYFFGLTLPLLGPDEPRYAQVAREMFERGDWITPTLGGANWFEKPALLYWLQIVSYKFFGVSEFAARFGSAAFGLGTIVCLWILGKILATENTEEDREVEVKDKIFLSSSSAHSVAKNDFADWLAIIAASSVGLIAFSRGASFDIILTFPITAALVSFFIFDQSKEKSFTTYHLPLTVFYFFVGVALLAKGLIGIVFPFAIVAFYFLLSRKLPTKTFIVSLFWGTLLSLLVASSWYLPIYLKHGWTFIDEFFIKHHFERYTSDVYQHSQPFWFVWLVLPLMTLPWLPFFLAAIWNFFKVQSLRFRVQSSESLSALRSPLSTFAFAWLFVPLVFFTFSGSKLPGYILPALPAASILTAQYIFKFVQKSARRKAALQGLAFAAFVAVAVLIQFALPEFSDRDSVKKLIEEKNAKGYAKLKITNLFITSSNAEFYAAADLVRNDDGKLKRYDSFAALVDDLKLSDTKEILVFVAHDGIDSLVKSELAETKLVADNGVTAIVLVKSKS